MKNIFTLLLVSIFSGAFFSLSAQQINSETSVVNFKVDNMKIGSAKGTFKGMTGKLHFHASHMEKASFDICVDANTIITGIDKRDTHLKTEDFFHTEKYPKICMKSNKITKKGDGFEVQATLTMHGISKELTIPLTFDGSTITSAFEIKRTDFKVGSDGTFTIGDEVEIEVTCNLK